MSLTNKLATPPTIPPSGNFKLIYADELVSNNLSVNTSGNFSIKNSNITEYIWPTVTPTLGQVLTVTDITSNVATLQYVSPSVAQAISNIRDRLIVPIYIYPSNPYTDYTTVGASMLSLLGRVDVIINPNNGDDALSAANSDWIGGLNALQTAASTSWSATNIYGYTYTQYGARSLATVKAVIAGYIANNWNLWVGGGIFLDEVSNDPDDFEYYTELIDYVLSLNPNLTVILNPGVALYENLATYTGVSCVINQEGASSSLINYTPANYQLYASDRNHYASISTGEADETLLPYYFNLNRTKNFGRFYVTSAANYNTLSSDYAALVTAFKTLL